MEANGSKSLANIGFLTICDYGDKGLFGGYLVLNAAGRPVEFHCTAPVRPSRAQEILYGPTLLPYLYGEQIGAALVGKSRSEPAFLCTDQEPVLALRPIQHRPLLLVRNADTLPDASRDDAPSRFHRLDEGHSRIQPSCGLPMAAFVVGPYEFATLASHSADRSSIEGPWSAGQVTIDLIEPFQRIRDAIREAHQANA